MSSPFGSLPNYVEVAVGGRKPQGHLSPVDLNISEALGNAS